MKEFNRSRSSFGSFIVDRRGTILGFDQAMEILTGWPAVEVVGRHKDLEERGDRSITTVALYDGQVAMEPGLRSLRLALNCRDGSRLDVAAMAKPLPGPGDRMHVTVLQVVARTPRRNGMRVLDRKDLLTGLPDRNAFASRLSSDLVSAATSAKPLALILLDIDHLREVNDRLGREAGDRVLQKLAGILRVSVEDEQRIARLGEDDFAVLLPESGRGEARQVAANLRSTVERYRFFEDTGWPEAPQITISLGAASFPADADGEADLLERAREALNEARSMGRNRVWCYLRRPRVPLEVPVFFDAAEALLVGYTRDLSPSGIFVHTSATIDVGMRCALTFPLPGHEGKVHVIGRVVRTVAEDVAERPEARLPGIGVEFERFGGHNDRLAIDAFLHHHESKTLRPESGMFSL